MPGPTTGCSITGPLSLGNDPGGGRGGGGNDVGKVANNGGGWFLKFG